VTLQRAGGYGTMSSFCHQKSFRYWSTDLNYKSIDLNHSCEIRVKYFILQLKDMYFNVPLFILDDVLYKFYFLAFFLS